MRTLAPALLLLAACAVAPVARQFERTAPIPGGDFAQTWDALVDLFGERTWPIQSMERASGIIATDWTGLGDMAESYMDCGKPSLGMTHRAREGRLNVVVREAESAVTVTVNAAMAAEVWNALNGWYEGDVECVSTGVLEREIHEEIQRRTAAP